MGGRIINARIVKTYLGIDDHGMTISFEFDSHGKGRASSGYGGYHYGHARFGVHPAYGQSIADFLDTIGVDSWEKVKGTIVRLKLDSEEEYKGKLIGIGHIIEDKWWWHEQSWEKAEQHYMKVNEKGEKQALIDLYDKGLSTYTDDNKEVWLHRNEVEALLREARINAQRK